QQHHLALVRLHLEKTLGQESDDHEHHDARGERGGDLVRTAVEEQGGTACQQQHEQHGERNSGQRGSLGFVHGGSPEWWHEDIIVISSRQAWTTGPRVAGRTGRTWKGGSRGGSARAAG